MPETINIRECRKLINNLNRKDYFSVAIIAYNSILNEIKDELRSQEVEDTEKQAARLILSRLHDVMRMAQPLVETRIQDRVNSGQISNADQARKSVAGNVFQQMFAYSLAINVLNGNIVSPIIVTTSTSGIVDEYAEIMVGDDRLKPDSDVIVYSSDESGSSPILVFSCKTSCRERAGQTYKWKLMCDIATCSCEHKSYTPSCPANIYNIAYRPRKTIKTCFVTTDFYNELSNPQISAMFNFFDYSYIGKTTSPNEKIHPLDTIVDDINTIFRTPEA